MKLWKLKISLPVAGSINRGPAISGLDRNTSGSKSGKKSAGPMNGPSYSAIRRTSKSPIRVTCMTRLRIRCEGETYAGARPRSIGRAMVNGAGRRERESNP